MPARGGNPSLSDGDLKAAILYMTKEAGFDLGGGEEKAKKAAPAPAAPVGEKAAATVAPTAAKTAVAPAAPATEQAVVKSAPATAIPVSAPLEPAKAADTKAAVEIVKEEPAAPIKPEPVVEPKKPEIPSTPVTPTIPSAPVAPAPKEAVEIKVRDAAVTE
jgi:hypothetical protein